MRPFSFLLRRAAMLAAILALQALPAAAQTAAWVQLEAVRTLDLAEARARAYAGGFRNVASFQSSTGWYAIALGPYSPADADAELAGLKRAGRIPTDAYVVAPETFVRQVWPAGASALGAPLAAPQAPAPAAGPDAGSAVLDEPGQGLRDAQASEAALDPADRQMVQQALKWEGFYESEIDGAFGPGTRRAMYDWQHARGHAATGILTAAQRGELIDGFQQVFRDFGLTALEDSAAGIALNAPLTKVARAGVEAPFVRYDPIDGDDIRLVLISQSGTKATLGGLYDVLQTLEVMPPEGFRERKPESFVLTGQSGTLHAYAYAALSDGAVKGFILAWPPAREAEMARIVPAMQASFRALPGLVLPDSAGRDGGAGQGVDLMAGLELRRPERTRTGFFVDATGRVLTTTDLLADCREITLGDGTEARVAARDDRTGLALLAPATPIAPIAVARFRAGIPRLGTEIAAAGFSYGNVLDLPVMSWGSLSDIRGLDGETTVDRLALTATPGDAGGPVLDPEGAVIGLLAARSPDATRHLPPDVAYAVNVAAIADFLDGAGLTPLAADAGGALAPEDLTAHAGDISVAASCWK